MASASSLFWAVNASPFGLCILRSCLLYVILTDFVSYAFLFTYLLECLPLSPYTIFVFVLSKPVFPLGLSALLLVEMPCSWPVQYALQIATVCMS